MSDKLKPCPFCGGIPIKKEELGSMHGPGGWEIKCSNWGCVTSKGGLTINEAITRWNTRTPQPTD